MHPPPSYLGKVPFQSGLAPAVENSLLVSRTSPSLGQREGNTRQKDIQLWLELFWQWHSSSSGFISPRSNVGIEPASGSFEGTEVAGDGESPYALSPNTASMLRLFGKCQGRDGHRPVTSAPRGASLTLSPNSGLRHQCPCKSPAIAGTQI